MADVRLHGRRAVITIDTVRVACGDDQGFDCEFDVEKDIGAKPNTASLQVWNLNEDHRLALSAKVAKKGSFPRVRIEAGYTDGTSRIFEGDVRHLWHERTQGGDIITHCETGDGERQVSRSRIFRSWSPGTPVEQVVKDVAAELGIGQGNINAAVAGAVLTGWGPTYTQGTSVAGKTVDVLNKVTRSVGLEWSIQDGVLQLLGDGRSLDGTAVLVSEETGLIGTPAIDHTGKNAGQLLFKTLMIPDVFPGRKVKVVSADVTGFYRIERAKYSGATSGPEWYINVEARAL